MPSACSSSASEEMFVVDLGVAELGGQVLRGLQAFLHFLGKAIDSHRGVLKSGTPLSNLLSAICPE